jgi:hypothetical protein
MDFEMVIAHRSFKLSNGWLIAFLESGNYILKNGTILRCRKSNQRWVIISTIRTTGSAKTYEQRNEEAKLGIYQYRLTGIDHLNKPEDYSILEIEK